MMTEAEQVEWPELMALSLEPSKRVCAFSGMKSFGSHYRIDTEEGGPRHVTFDSGVAELHSRAAVRGANTNSVQVQLVRVGVLKNILVLSYGNLNIVLMVVSWVAKHTEERPRLRRDAHGFWLANMAARPRDTANPYLLPALASQVAYEATHTLHYWEGMGLGIDQLQVAPLTHIVVYSRCSSCRTRQCRAGLWS
jgi:hypothetical protein